MTKNRSDWPVKKYQLGSEPSDDLSESTTPEERLQMMDELSRSAWLLSERPLPDYSRKGTPVRVLRRKSA